MAVDKQQIDRGVWPKRPDEVYYWFDWDPQGHITEVTEDEAMSVDPRSYARVLFNCADLKFRTFVPVGAGQAVATLVERRMKQWLKERWGMSHDKDRIANLNVDDDTGKYYVGETMKPKRVLIPENIGGVSNETPT